MEGVILSSFLPVAVLAGGGDDGHFLADNVSLRYHASHFGWRRYGGASKIEWLEWVGVGRGAAAITQTLEIIRT
jgi:hypothetical protein